MRWFQLDADTSEDFAIDLVEERVISAVRDEFCSAAVVLTTPTDGSQQPILLLKLREETADGAHEVGSTFCQLGPRDDLIKPEILCCLTIGSGLSMRAATVLQVPNNWRGLQFVLDTGETGEAPVIEGIALLLADRDEILTLAEGPGDAT